MFTVITANGNYFIHCEQDDISGLQSLGLTATENPQIWVINPVSIAMLLEECGFTADMDNFGTAPQRT
jgi:hypothetical protein